MKAIKVLLLFILLAMLGFSLYKINEIKKECKFKESKHLAKQKAKEEAKKNHEDYKQVKGI